MFSSQIYRYLTREILAPTLLCLLVFTLVLLMGRLIKLVDLVINKGVSFSDIIGLFMAMTPSFLTITLPLAFLMGVMIGFGRLSTDSETVALKAAGISLTGIAVPVFILALVFSVITGTIGIWGQSWGYRTFKAKVFEITQKQATVGFQPRVFMNRFPGLVVYANDLDNRTGEIKGLFVKEIKSDGNSMIFAKRGHVYSDPGNETVVIRLLDGVIHHQKGTSYSDYQLIHFSSYDVRPDLGAGLEASRSDGASHKIKPKELSIEKLLAATRDGRSTDRFNALRAELHQRLTTPLAPLLFALFGVPFSIQSHRSGRSGGFVIGLVIYLAYYILRSLAGTLTSEVGISPWLTFWAMHAVLILAGMYCLRMSSLERQNVLVNSIESTLQWLKRKSKPV